MNRNAFQRFVFSSFSLILVLSMACQEQARGGTSLYPSMAPIDRYLMANQTAEVALAVSAAPAAISRDATVLVLGRHGYQTVKNGKDGFTCLVERAWMSPFDSPEFWNPKIRGPICYNPAASRTILLYTFKRTELALAGLPKDQMLDRIKAALAAKQLPAPEPGAMSYMMSKNQYLGDAGGAWHPHLMFHVPKADGASWGADLPGSPILLDTAHREVPEPETIFMITVGTWSDGTPAPPISGM
jgi:hypothetical protein